MPGLNLLFCWDEEAKRWASLFSQTQKLHKHSPDYGEKILFSDDHCILGTIKYESYPLSIFDTPDHKIFKEGIIYNKTEETVQLELSHLGSALDSNPEQADDEVKRWMLEADGDYIISIYNPKKKSLYLFNDLLGRLPFYYYTSDRFILFSREPGFILPFLKDIVFEKEILAEYLLFSAPLEKNTLLSKIYRASASTLMKTSKNEKEITQSRLHIFNLDERKNSQKRIEENAVELKNIFLEACQNRVRSLPQSKIVLSLSGGLDSRSVGIGLKEIGATFSGATFIDHQKLKFAKDAETARTIAERLKIPWELFRLSPPGIEETETLLRFKSGLIYGGLNFILNFFETLDKKHGKETTYWTGDEGNGSLGNNSPPKSIRHIDELVEFIIDILGITSVNRIEEFLGIDGQKLKNKIKKIVLEYPEKNLDDKYLHFYFFEYLYKLQFEGEDKNRFYFWTVAPMYSRAFFEYAINIPDRQKKYHKLYKEFMNVLSPEMANIKSASLDYPVTAEWKFRLKENGRWFFYNLPFFMRDYVKRKKSAKRKAFKSDPNFKEYFSNILEKSQIFPDNRQNYVQEVLLSDGMSVFEFWNLLSIASLVQGIEKKYYEKNIILR